RRFAELGVDSFGAQELRRRLGAATGVELPLVRFLGTETPRDVLAALAGAAPRTAPAPPPVPPSPPGTARVTGSTDSAPLTPVQAAYWVGRRPDLPLGGSATFWFHEYDRTPDGDPHADLDRLEAAWNRLVDLHPMLRATVGRDGLQRCAPPGLRARIARTDLRDAEPAVVERRLAEIRAERSHQVRDPARWPLFDLHASLLPGGTTRLSVGFDILVLDFASWRLLLEQWGRLVAEPDTSLPEPPVGFLDIVRHRAADPAYRARRERAREHWRERIAALPPGPALPLAGPPEEIARLVAPRFRRHRRTLPAEQWRRLAQRCGEHGVSPSAVLLSAFALTLQRWGATEAFTLTATLFDRPDDVPGVEHVVGDFTTTAPVAVPAPDPLDRPRFADFAREVNARFWTAIDHRAVSGVELLRELPAPASGLPHHPVVFTSGLGVGETAAAPARLLGREVFGVSQTPQVLLDHLVWEDGGELVMAVDAVTEAFPAGFVEGLTGACHRLVGLLATDPDAWTAADLGWEPDFRRPGPLDVAPFPGAGPLLDDPRRRAAERAPQALALIGGDTVLGHDELDRRARAVAAALVAAGVDPGDLVLVALPKGVAQIVATIGVELAGAGYVPVDPGWPGARIEAVCTRAAVRHALMLDTVPVALPGDLATTVLTPGGSPTTPVAPLAEPVPGDPAGLAYVIFTSGSTGEP
ncbi:MAG TPA: AMP-binding protein, partial [Pseudonocardia sp.]|nr:AMP-binding protein [Pseudonocardia sp.]